MPDIRTEISEIVTGLGVMGYKDAQSGLGAAPAKFLNVEQSNWTAIQRAQAAGQYSDLIDGAFENGKTFLVASDGLRGRPPARIEWKGAHRPPGYDLIPADIRIDHVYLISCKYQSKILFNPSPVHLFERGLAVRSGSPSVNWYRHVAGIAYDSLYSGIRNHYGLSNLPQDAGSLTKPDRQVLKPLLAGRHWAPSLLPLYESLSDKVSTESCRIWSRSFTNLRQQEEMYWRIIRLASAPYFVLGTNGTKHMRLRVCTPWDWRNEFSMRKFECSPALGAGQPKVQWHASITETSSGAIHDVNGHIEVRWSHGRFQGNPEAKVYLDTPHIDVPGYFPI